MALLLIRHGETDLNATRVVQFPHTPLGQNGIAQADRLGHFLKTRSIDLVLTSDYRRARMTADRLVLHTGTRLLESAHLRERDFGDIRGTPYDQLGALDIFAPDYAPPGGESWAVFDARVDRAWEEVMSHAAALRGDVAIVTHGLVLRSLLQRKLDASGHRIDADLVVANTSMTIVDAAPPWRVTDLARVDHLDPGQGLSAPV